MVSLIHKKYPDWSVRKIAKKIWIDNEDLEGVTINHILGHLDDTNRKLLDEYNITKK